MFLLDRRGAHQSLGRVKTDFCMACSLQAVMEETYGRRKHAFTPYQIANRLHCMFFLLHLFFSLRLILFLSDCGSHAPWPSRGFP